jgi:hypothetical protein
MSILSEIHNKNNNEKTKITTTSSNAEERMWTAYESQATSPGAQTRVQAYANTQG